MLLLVLCVGRSVLVGDGEFVEELGCPAVEVGCFELCAPERVLFVGVSVQRSPDERVHDDGIGSLRAGGDDHLAGDVAELGELFFAQPREVVGRIQIPREQAGMRVDGCCIEKRLAFLSQLVEAHELLGCHVDVDVPVGVAFCLGAREQIEFGAGLGDGPNGIGRAAEVAGTSGWVLDI